MTRFSRIRSTYKRFKNYHPVLTTFAFILLATSIATGATALAYNIYWNLIPETERTEIIAKQTAREETNEHHNKMLEERFGPTAATHMTIMVDQETGVTYITYTGEKKFAMTALLDADGSPHIDEDWLAQHQNS